MKNMTRFIKREKFTTLFVIGLKDPKVRKDFEMYWLIKISGVDTMWMCGTTRDMIIHDSVPGGKS